MWKGAISFGLVTIPVAVYPATEEKSLKFNQLHDEDHGRIKYKRVCSIDGEEVEFEHIVKGYEVEKDRYVILTDDDFDAVPVESSRAIDIQQFVELDEIDPILFKKSYYLVPEETGAKAYALLRKALTEEGKVGIAKVSFRDKEHLSALRFKEDVFVLETMYWPDEVRAAEFDTVPADEKVRENDGSSMALVDRQPHRAVGTPRRSPTPTARRCSGSSRRRWRASRSRRRPRRPRRRPHGGAEGLGRGRRGRRRRREVGRRSRPRRSRPPSDRRQARHRREEAGAAEEGLRRVAAPPATPTDLG